MAGHYHGFLWFYFINEQLLRFLNLRYPRDYDTVPRVWFWLFHLVWLFPWSVYLPAVSRLSFKPVDRAGKARLLALCWIGFVLVFFTFSTTQEYYSMPCYPAFALLLGSAMAAEGSWIRGGTRTLSTVAGIAAIACLSILIAVRHVPTPGDITAALSVTSQRLQVIPRPYGRPHDGLIRLLAGSADDRLRRLSLRRSWWAQNQEARDLIFVVYLAAALMMVIFFQAARLAMVKFDPLLSSRDFATAILKDPPGQIILDHSYYWFSSIPFYTNRPVLLL